MKPIKIFILYTCLSAFLFVPFRSIAQIGGNFTGNYFIYSGGIGDPQKPIPNQKKIALEINGRAAKEIFDSIGPDIHDACGASEGLRNREKNGGALSCSRSAKGEYRCHVGFDLKTGKSIVGVVC